MFSKLKKYCKRRRKESYLKLDFGPSLRLDDLVPIVDADSGDEVVGQKRPVFESNEQTRLPCTAVAQ